MAKKRGGSGNLIIAVAGAAAAAVVGGAVILTRTPSTSGGGGPPPGSKTVPVTVSVTDATTGAPVVAQVELGPAYGTGSTVTLQIVPSASPINLGVSANGYVEVNQSQVISSATTIPVALTSSVTSIPCDQLVPALIQADAVVDVSLTWAAVVYCDGSSPVEWGAVPGNPSSCPIANGGAGSLVVNGVTLQNIGQMFPVPHYFTGTLSGTVIDEGGVGVCSQTVAVTVSPSGAVGWSAAGGQLGGNLTVSAPASVTTDQNGDFSVEVTVTLDLTSWQEGLNCLGDLTSAANVVGSFSLPTFVVQYLVEGYGIPGSSNLNITNQMCAWFTL